MCLWYSLMNVCACTAVRLALVIVWSWRIFWMNASASSGLIWQARRMSVTVFNWSGLAGPLGGALGSGLLWLALTDTAGAYCRRLLAWLLVNHFGCDHFLFGLVVRCC